MNHLGYQGSDRDPEEDLMELELWFGSPEKPFRFQGEPEAWEVNYLDKTYSGSPDECSWCFRQGLIMKFDQRGNCPNSSDPNHPKF